MKVAVGQSSTPIPIISAKDVVNPDGTYAYGYETGNGIKVDVTGGNNQEIGSVKYQAPDGSNVEWTYVADANGYQPQGSAIPAVPEYVGRALKYIQEHSTPSPVQN